MTNDGRLYYRNEGAEFPLGARTIGRGDVFRAHPTDAAIVRRSYKLTLLGPHGVSTAPEPRRSPTPRPATPEDAEGDVEEAWDDVQFASPEAEDLARAEGLTRAELLGFGEGSSATGRLLKRDVMTIIREREEGEGGD